LDRSLVAITGASSGIGEAFARKLAPGHNLLLIARRRDRLESLADEFSNKFGTRSEVLAADLSQEKDLNTVADRLSSADNLALLINNAGFGTRGRFWETDLADADRMHKLHVMATMRLTHAALKTMVAADFGGIINVASVLSFLRTPGSTSYCATKAWMTAFTESLYVELKSIHSGVVVQALCPGLTHSGFHEAMGSETGGPAAPPGWWMMAEDVVDASIDGLRRGKLFVVPGWRYKLITALVPRLPTPIRTTFEAAARARTRRTPVSLDAGKRIESEG
jgi:uncharacterized protein